MMLGAQARLLGAIIVRDALIAASYRVGFALGLVGSLVNVLLLFFLGRAFAGTAAPALERYGGEYFGFVVLGVAFTILMTLGLGGLAAVVRQGQLTGTLELLVLGATPLPLVLLYSASWSHLAATGTVVVYFVAGIVLGLDAAGANWLTVVAGYAMSVLAFNSLGLLAAAVVIVVKQGNPVTWLLTGASTLLGGVFYPVSVLPDPLPALANLLPLTHALEIVRRATLTGAGIAELAPSFIALAGLTLVYLPLGIVASARAISIARTDGSLAQY